MLVVILSVALKELDDFLDKEGGEHVGQAPAHAYYERAEVLSLEGLYDGFNETLLLLAGVVLSH